MVLAMFLGLGLELGLIGTGLLISGLPTVNTHAGDRRDVGSASVFAF